MIETALSALGFALVLVGVVLAYHSSTAPAREDKQDPQAVLRHCRQELQLVEIELSSYPATRDIHEIFEGIHSAQRTIDQVARRLKSQPRELEVVR